VRELGARLVTAQHRALAVRGRRRQLDQLRARDVRGVLEDVAHIVAGDALQDHERVDIAERAGAVAAAASRQERGSDRDGIELELHRILLEVEGPSTSTGPTA